MGAVAGRSSGRAPAGLETSWIKASQAGDASAFNCLVLKWETKIYNLSLRILQDREEAAEATQEAFLAAFRHIGSFRLDSSFSTWLYRIASNKCLSRLRKRPPRTPVSLDQEESEIWEPRLAQAHTQDHQLWEKERRGQILEALQSLNRDQRIVVELKIFQERKFDEIGQILELPVSTVKSRFYSSLQVLKPRLAHLDPAV